jgi:spermidine synthase
MVPRIPQPSLPLTVFVVGLSILGAEIAAARLLAPYFGASTIVWANTIGIVLTALSIGYWYGGKLADRNPTYQGLYRIVLVAGLLLGAVPFIADPFLDLAVSALDSISAGAFVGSLVAVLALVAVPVLVSGAVAPYALRLAVQGVEEAGTISGRLYAISTIGSLLGTFTSALLFIPLLGTRRTFLVYAFLLVLVAAAGLAQRRMVLAPAAIALLALVPVGAVKAADVPAGARVIHETDTEHQYARVVERRDGTRLLELNEGQAVHSMRKPGTVLTDNIWDDYLITPFAAQDRPPGRIAILGNAAGTTARAYGHFFPQTEIHGVEIDGDLTEIGRDYFSMQAPDLTTYTADARPFLRQTDLRFDAIFVDAYRQPYIPFYLSTVEFFELVRDRLNPGGVVVVNAGHPAGSTTLEKVLGATMAEVFGTVVRDPSQRVNTLLMGTDERADGRRLAAAVPSLPPELQPLGAAAAARIEPYLPGGAVYTDDKAPVEWLIDSSIVEFAAGGEAE